jgi:hypothetical protein
MKKTVNNLLNSQTKDLRDLKNFMFAKDYWKFVDKNSHSVENAINNSLDIGRKSVKTATIISSSIGLLVGGLLGTIFE